jgi:hypothetical protein
MTNNRIKVRPLRLRKGPHGLFFNQFGKKVYLKGKQAFNQDGVLNVSIINNINRKTRNKMKEDDPEEGKVRPKEEPIKRISRLDQLALRNQLVTSQVPGQRAQLAEQLRNSAVFRPDPLLQERANLQRQLGQQDAKIADLERQINEAKQKNRVMNEMEMRNLLAQAIRDREEIDRKFDDVGFRIRGSEIEDDNSSDSKTEQDDKQSNMTEVAETVVDEEDPQKEILIEDDKPEEPEEKEREEKEEVQSEIKEPDGLDLRQLLAVKKIGKKRGVVLLVDNVPYYVNSEKSLRGATKSINDLSRVVDILKFLKANPGAVMDITDPMGRNLVESLTEGNRRANKILITLPAGQVPNIDEMIDSLESRPEAGNAFGLGKKEKLKAGELASTPKENIEYDGSYDKELEQMLLPYREYVGTIMLDQLPELLQFVADEGKYKFGFIINTEPESEQGEHWQAVYCDLVDRKNCCMYDSFAEPMGKGVVKTMTNFVRAIDLPYMVKFKYNKEKHQDARSGTCGYMTVRFLHDMFRGKCFKKATDFGIEKGEKVAKEYMKSFKKFGYV